ncbi:hypothetical protein B7486_03245 [cyanobacterium TDX16]|nr:hypothetical protein B7486_03245 [cyanobacterium TDX16]
MPIPGDKAVKADGSASHGLPGTRDRPGHGGPPNLAGILQTGASCCQPARDWRPYFFISQFGPVCVDGSLTLSGGAAK